MKSKIIFKILMMGCLAISFPANADHHHDHHAHKTAEQEKPLSDESVYNLNSQLLDQDGNVFALSNLRGHQVVISMAYTGCVYTCPLILAQMQQLEKALLEKGKKDVLFVLVSFDPQRDTPEVLKNYMAKKNLSSNWHLLTAKTDKEPRGIASLLGIKYKKIEGGDYDHSFVIAVLDKEGVVVGRQIGANQDPKDLRKFLP